ncbi:MAG: SulP family inorganic anion transporter [Chitinophagaceae bacterium]|nr:MAG: SulP family inorganic anion transporter [Chitinophagaceae bacterium]
MKAVSIQNLKSDLSSGIVVFLVAVPLCLGIALASGAPFFSGLIAGITGGIVIGFLSNSHLSVSGPAAGLTAIVVAGIAQLGSFNVFLAAVVLAGLFQLVFGFLKAGSVANYFPGSVIKGMLTAIGIIIILKQLPHAVGYDNASGTSGTGIKNLSDLFSAAGVLLNRIHPGVIIITAVSLITLLVWDKPFMKRLRIIPGALAAVLVGVFLNLMFTAFAPTLMVSSKFLVQIPVAGNLSEFAALFTFPDFSKMLSRDVILTGATIAAVASIETLLCIDAIDKIDPLRRVTDQNKELKAQGVGNIISGMLGGLPVTSVIVRSSANINAGAKTKMSTIIHGMLILACSALIPWMLNKIPLGALAAILLVTGYKLAKISVFKSMYANGRFQFMPFIVTVIAVVFTDLLTGVALGLLVSMFGVMYVNMKNPYYFHKRNYHQGEKITIALSEEVTFLNKASIKLTLDQLPAGSSVVIDASNTRYIDFDVMEIIKDFKEIQAPEKHISCVLVGFKENYPTDNSHYVSLSLIPSRGEATGSRDQHELVRTE